MGYCTRFELTTKNNKYKVSEITEYMMKKWCGLDKYYPFKRYLDDYLLDENVYDLELGITDSYKWYSYDEEMLELSKKFPETVFCLYGDGEEGLDVWRKYYKDGKSQYCPSIVTFDEYDESKLK